MDKHSKKKKAQLGMPIGTAQARLRKSLLFSILKRYKLNFCFQCSSEIENEEELSIEHKIPWLDSVDPKELFFNLDNIAFSHLSCNIGAARKSNLGSDISKHGSLAKYTKGCRCDNCIEAMKLWQRERRKVLKTKG